MATYHVSSTLVRDGSKFTEKLLSGVRQFYDDQKLVDVTFKVSNPTVLIPAHRLVLSVASSYFENLLSSDQGVTSFIEIDNIASDTFERLITYCYTGKTLITVDNVDEMLKGTIILQLDDAVVDCVDYIFENITEYTLERAYSLERETQCERLRQKIEKYEIQHFMKISGSVEFLNFDSEKLKRLLESEDLNVSCEEDVFAAIKSWYEHDTVSRECHLHDLIGCLRLLQFDENFMLTNIQPLPGCESLALKAIVWVSQPLARTKISLKFTQPRKSLRQQRREIGCLEETSYFAVQRSEDNDTRCLLRYNKTEDKWLKYAEIDFKDVEEYGVILRDDNLIFIGGRKNGHSINEVRSWNLHTKTWKQLPAMTCPRETHSVALLDGKIYAIGGENEGIAIKSVEVLSPTGEWHCVRNMNTPRKDAPAVTLNGQIFVMGGHHIRKNTVERYDPTTNVWTSCANMNNSYVFHGAAVHKGFIFVVGKEAAERYDPQRDEWTKITALPTKTFSVACISLNNQLWAIGSSLMNAPKDCAYAYDEESDRWVEKARLPKAGYYSCFAVSDALL